MIHVGDCSAQTQPIHSGKAKAQGNGVNVGEPERFMDGYLTTKLVRIVWGCFWWQPGTRLILSWLVTGFRPQGGVGFYLRWIALWLCNHRLQVLDQKH